MPRPKHLKHFVTVELAHGAGALCEMDISEAVRAFSAWWLDLVNQLSKFICTSIEKRKTQRPSVRKGI
jgi:hypothetical protein